MRLINAYNKIQKIEVDKPPFCTTRLFPTGFRAEVFGDQICFGEDYVDIEEARVGIEWIVNQLGGKVKWER